MTAPLPVKGLLAALLLPVFTFAAPVAVTNPGFEDISGETPFNEFTFGPLNGWNLYDPENITSGGPERHFLSEPSPRITMKISRRTGFFPAGAAEGERVGIAFNFAVSGGQGEYGLQQTLSATLLIGTARRHRRKANAPA